jgi:hypothetical protein
MGTLVWISRTVLDSGAVMSPAESLHGANVLRPESRKRESQLLVSLDLLYKVVT